MTNEEIKNKFSQIFLDVFNLPENVLIEDQSIDTIREWDSLGHLRIITKIQNEFKISIDDQTALTLLSVPSILIYLGDKLK